MVNTLLFGSLLSCLESFYINEKIMAMILLPAGVLVLLLSHCENFILLQQKIGNADIVDGGQRHLKMETSKYFKTHHLTKKYYEVTVM